MLIPNDPVLSQKVAKERLITAKKEKLKARRVACLECRNKKLKCDKRCPCGRCVEHALQCVYVPHRKTGPKINLERLQAEELAAKKPVIRKDPELEKQLGIDRLGLTMVDIAKLHDFYFSHKLTTFKCSGKRYLAKFNEQPERVLMLSYMIWALAALYFPEYQSLSEKIYEMAFDLLADLDELSTSPYQNDPLSMLWALAMKTDYESVRGKVLAASLTNSSAMRLAHILGLDQIDMPGEILNCSPVDMSPMAALNIFQVLKHEPDDNLDPKVPLLEEKRRLFWQVFVLDKWYSMMMSQPATFCPDDQFVIYTRLPAANSEQTEDPDSQPYYHEILEKVENRTEIVQTTTSASRVIALGMADAITDWCKMFLTTTSVNTLRSDDILVALHEKMQVFIHYFDAFRSNMLFFDLNVDPLIDTVPHVATIFLYQTVLLKLSCLFDIQMQEKPPSIISQHARDFFKRTLHGTMTLSMGILKKVFQSPDFDSQILLPPFASVTVSALKALGESVHYVRRFRQIIQFDREPALEKLLEDVHKRLEPSKDNPLHALMIKVLLGVIDGNRVQSQNQLYGAANAII